MFSKVCFTLLAISIALSSFAQGRIMINADFEQPLLPSPNSFRFINHNSVPGWSTTASGQLLEIWRTPYNGVIAPSGEQFMELNANQPADLFFETCMFNNETVSWSFYHRGRSGLDSAQLLIGPVGSEVEVLRFGTDRTAWRKYSGTYTNTNGDAMVRFRFRPISTASGNSTVGNFVDNVEIRGLPPIVEFAEKAYGDMEDVGGNIPVLLVNGYIPTGGLSVDIREMSSGTAISNADFNNTRTFIIPEGNYDGTMNTAISLVPVIKIIDDNINEGDEFIDFQLINPEAPLRVYNADCDSEYNSETRYTIMDNEILLNHKKDLLSTHFSCEKPQEIFLTWNIENFSTTESATLLHSFNGKDWSVLKNWSPQHPKGSYQHLPIQRENYYKLQLNSMDESADRESKILFERLHCQQQKDLNIFPNQLQAGDKINIQSTHLTGNLQIKITDLYGKILHKKQLNNFQYQHQISVDLLPKGAYFLILSDENGLIHTQKILITS